MPVANDTLSDALQNCPHLELLASLCKDKTAYIVGGALRDALLHRPISDLDLIFAEDPTPLARSFAKIIGGHWFWLDRERRQSRVVLKGDAQAPFYDFAPFRAVDLEQDLLDRDFTINALALPLHTPLSAAALVAPGDAITDLLQRKLRMVGKDSLRNDPLRIIKGLRHAATLDFAIEEQTLRAMQEGAARLSMVAVERIRQEIWKIFAHEQQGRALSLLQLSGVGEQLFGHGFANSVPRLIEKCAACHERLQQMLKSDPVATVWLQEELEQGLVSRTLLIWSLLLATIDPELPARMARQWRLSRKVKASLGAILALDEIALREFASLARTERAYAWWAKRRNLSPRLLLLALAAKFDETDLPLAELSLWISLVQTLADRQPGDLVDGHWLRNVLELDEGPEMTKALELLRNSEMSGKVSNEQEAQQFLYRFYHNKD